MCYPNCLACDKALNGAEMGRKYTTHDEYIGLCTPCHVISGIKNWTSTKKEQNEIDHQSATWEAILQESFEQDRLSEEELERFNSEEYVLLSVDSSEGEHDPTV